MKKLVELGSAKAKKLLDGFDIKKITSDFKAYYFTNNSKKKLELKKELFFKSHKVCRRIVKSIKSVQSVLKNYKLAWNFKRDIVQLETVVPKLLDQIEYFIIHGEVAPGKILSLHAKEVKCIAKGKVGKKYEFGRKFFIGRLPGNYAYTFTGNDFALEDAYSLKQGLKEYKSIFDVLPESLSGDQTFWSEFNLKACKKIKEAGINPRGRKVWKIPQERVEEVKKRRAKVEPIIGHLKRRGMGKSKMKSDAMTKLDGQRSALSLNLSRMARDLSERELKWAG